MIKIYVMVKNWFNWNVELDKILLEWMDEHLKLIAQQITICFVFKFLDIWF